MLKRTAGSSVLSSKSPNSSYPILGDNRDPVLGARRVGIQP